MDPSGTGRILIWEQAGVFSREHHLLADGRPIAAMRVLGFLGRRAGVESAEGRWRLEVEGFLGRAVRIRDASRDLGRLDEGWLGRGSLRLADGRSFPWRRPSLWRSEWVLARPGGEALLRIRSPWSWLRSRGRIELEPGAEELGPVAPFAALAWFVVVNQQTAAGGGG